MEDTSLSLENYVNISFDWLSTFRNSRPWRAALPLSSHAGVLRFPQWFGPYIEFSGFLSLDSTDILKYLIST